MDVIEALREAHTLIGKGWTQGSAARDKYGNTCEVHSPATSSWCAAGALFWATVNDNEIDPDNPEFCLSFTRASAALTAAMEDLWGIKPHDEFKPWHEVEMLKVWNDEKGRVKNEVLRLYARAIEMCTTAQDAPELVEA